MTMELARRRVLRLTTGAAALAAVSRSARANSYPIKPVRLVVPVPPGGTFDIVGRLIAHWLSEHLGRQFVVENRPGAGTNLGTGVVAHSAPDGYTLLIDGSPAAINATLYKDLDFDFRRDIVPVAGIERLPLVVAVNPSLPVESLPQFISYAKVDSSKINMGSGGIGSTGQVAGELFNMMAGLNLIDVPYRGEAPALTDLLRGQVQIVFTTAGSAIGFIKAGTLRAIAVTSGERMSTLPDVPTVAETLPGYEAFAWSGIGAPTGTPPEIIETLNRVTNAALADTDLRSRLAALGATAMPGSPADFGKFIASEIEKWAKVVKFARIKV
jgi:tripartite-type tricarboxylate transporter receptor subunit TctC